MIMRFIKLYVLFMKHKPKTSLFILSLLIASSGIMLFAIEKTFNVPLLIAFVLYVFSGVYLFHSQKGVLFPAGDALYRMLSLLDKTDEYENHCLKISFICSIIANIMYVIGVAISIASFVI